MTLWNNADALIQAVASQNNNTIVITHSVGPSIIESWIDHPNVTGVCVPLLFLEKEHTDYRTM